MAKTIFLKPIAMVVPTEECIYAPSRIQAKFAVSRQQFRKEYAGNAHTVQVSFEPDGKSNPRNIPSYTGANPMMGRYIEVD
ncbi:MAG: hypothetical protein GY743_23420 [Planctomycetaceae bacterium]|nr:hypothetical protein [Planctomycetaceae bacterium]